MLKTSQHTIQCVYPNEQVPFGEKKTIYEVKCIQNICQKNDIKLSTSKTKTSDPSGNINNCERNILRLHYILWYGREIIVIGNFSRPLKLRKREKRKQNTSTIDDISQRIKGCTKLDGWRNRDVKIQLNLFDMNKERKWNKVERRHTIRHSATLNEYGKERYRNMKIFGFLSFLLNKGCTGKIILFR